MNEHSNLAIGRPRHAGQLVKRVARGGWSLASRDCTIHAMEKIGMALVGSGAAGILARLVGIG